MITRGSISTRQIVVALDAVAVFDRGTEMNRPVAEVFRRLSRCFIPTEVVSLDRVDPALREGSGRY